MEDFNMEKYKVLSAVFNITPENTFVKSTDFIYIAASESFAKSIGKMSAEEVVGKTDYELFEPTLAEKHRKEDMELLECGSVKENILEEFVNSDGQVRYDSISKYCLKDKNGEHIGIYGIQHDVTQDVLAKERYDREIEYLFDMDVNVCSAHLIDVNEWVIVNEKSTYKNNVPMRRSVEEFRQAILQGICSMESDAYKFYDNMTPEHLHNIYQGGQRNFMMEYRRILPSGELCWIQDDIRFISNPENGHLLLAFIISDIDEKKQKEQELIRRAETDGLTGLFNRNAFLKKAKNILKTENGPDTKHALFMLDVDNFKKLNDTQGHRVGDRFLIEMSAAIRSCFRNTDIIGRLGGDEFLVLMRQTPNNEITTKNANELLKKINGVCSYYDMPELSVSIGISNYPTDGTSFDELYDRADEALYRAKKFGKSRFEFFNLHEKM